MLDMPAGRARRVATGVAAEADRLAAAPRLS